MLYPAFARVFVLLCAVAVIDSPAESVARFDVASIKLNVSGTTTMKFPPPAGGRFEAINFPLKALITFAYGVTGAQIFGAPDWTNVERFDVEARADSRDVTREQYQTMLRSLLEERFRLNAHRETRELPAYELWTARTGTHLKPANAQACDQPGVNGDQSRGRNAGVACGAFFTGPSSLDGRSMSMAGFCDALSIVLGRPVTDHTRLSGRYDIHLEFDPEGVNLGNGPSALSANTKQSDNELPSIFSALQNQLGLKLQAHKEATEVIVIDRLERLPSAN